MRWRVWVATGAVAVCLAPVRVAAASPTARVVTPGDLSTVLVDPPTSDFIARPNGLVGSTHVGPLDLETLVAESNGEASVRAEFISQHFRRGYRKVWVQRGTSVVLIEKVEEFAINAGAQDHQARAKFADQLDNDFRSFFDTSGIPNAYGDRFVAPDSFETDSVVFAKGNLVLVVAAGQSDVPSTDIALSQARREYAFAPDQTIDQSGAAGVPLPPMLAAAGRRLSAVTVAVVLGALLVLAIPALLVALIAARRGQPRPLPLLSADRRYWWNGTAWLDTFVSVPDGARRSPDGAYWFDGVAWRPTAQRR